MNRILIIFLLLIIITTTCYTQTEIIFRVTEHPPYYYLEDGVWSGISIELANTLLKEAGFSIIYKNLPWKRALFNLKKGEIDFMTNLSITDDRKKFIHYIGPQMYETMILVLSKDSNLIINNFEDIKKIPGKLGIQLGVYYGEEFHNRMETDSELKKKFIIVATGDSLVKLVHAKRLVGFISSGHEFYYNQKLYDDFKNLKDHNFIIHKSPIYFGFSKESYSEGQIIEIQEAYNRVVKRGGFKIIIDKYKNNDL